MQMRVSGIDRYTQVVIFPPYRILGVRITVYAGAEGGGRLVGLLRTAFIR